ncbi:MAG TPA: DciA family protein [Magnetospirillaceae bacterium]|jgi:hypothetical protein
MVAKPSRKSDERSGRYEPRPIGEISGRIVAKPLGKRGFAAATLAADWPAIVGTVLSAQTLPLRIVFPRGERNQGTLHMRVASGAFALQVQHLEPQIIQRVNGHFGYAAVARLALTQGPIPQRKPKRVPVPPPSAEVDPALKKRIETVSDDDLREALAGLGRRLAAGWQRS